MLIVSVADTGIGIAPRDLPASAIRSSRPAHPMTGAYEGTGLGLSVVRGLVGLHGGSISVESELGKGTCVSVRLPLDCRRFAGSKNRAAKIETMARRSRLDDPRQCQHRNDGEENCVKLSPVAIMISSSPNREEKQTQRRNGRHDALLRILRFARHAADYPNRIAGTVLVGLVIAIFVNALVLQQSRPSGAAIRQEHRLSTTGGASTRRRGSRGPRPQRRRPRAPAQPSRDAIGQFLQSGAIRRSLPEPTKATGPRAAVKEGTAEAKPAPSRDPISQLLKSDTAPAPEQSKTVLAAQRALMKLGFVLKPDGLDGGATRQAIEQFERDRGLPVNGELSPKLLHLLSAESGIAIE